MAGRWWLILDSGKVVHIEREWRATPDGCLDLYEFGDRVAVLGPRGWRRIEKCTGSGADLVDGTVAWCPHDLAAAILEAWKRDRGGSNPGK